MSPTVTATTPTTTRPARRAPWPVWTLSSVVLLLALVTSYGAVYFTFVFGDPDPGLGSWVFVAVFFAINIVAAAAAVGLVRGSRLAWRVLVGYGALGILWCVAKLVFWSETESLAFGALNVVCLALLSAPRTRAYLR